MLISRYTKGENYKLSDILPIDILLYIAYFKKWPISERKTIIRFIPADHQRENYIIPHEPQTVAMIQDFPKKWGGTQYVKETEIFKFADSDTRWVWRIGYAPEIDMLFIGMDSDGYFRQQY